MPVFSAGLGPQAVTAADFDGDGDLDLAVTNPASNYSPGTVSVLLGNGGGAFSGPTDFLVGYGPHSVVAGDFNGDGHLDLAAANFWSNTVSVRLGDGVGLALSWQPT